MTPPAPERHNSHTQYALLRSQARAILALGFFTAACSTARKYVLAATAHTTCRRAAGRHRRAGLLLGCVVLLSDTADNGYANYSVLSGHGVTAGRAGQAIITVLAVALVVVAPQVCRGFAQAGRAMPRGSAAAVGLACFVMAGVTRRGAA